MSQYKDAILPILGLRLSNNCPIFVKKTYLERKCFHQGTGYHPPNQSKTQKSVNGAHISLYGLHQLPCQSHSIPLHRHQSAGPRKWASHHGVVHRNKVQTCYGSCVVITYWVQDITLTIWKLNNPITQIFWKFTEFTFKCVYKGFTDDGQHGSDNFSYRQVSSNKLNQS